MNNHFEWLNPPHNRDRHKSIDWTKSELVRYSEQYTIVIVYCFDMWFVCNVPRRGNSTRTIVIAKLYTQMPAAKLYYDRRAGIMVAMNDLFASPTGELKIITPIPF